MKKGHKAAFVVNDALPPVCPSAIKIDARNFREYVHHHRRPAHAKKLVSFDKILLRQPFQRCAEFHQRSKYRLSVLGIWPNKQIDVFRRPRLGMEGHSIAAYDQVLNILGMEDGQEFFQVVEHPVPVPSSCKPPE